VLGVLGVLALAGCRGSGPDERSAAAGKVVELASVNDLRTAFTAAAGKPRVVLLLSPT
jgi:hypothetical protein